MHPHETTRLRNVAQLVGQREQPEAIADQYVMLCHDDCSFPRFLAEQELEQSHGRPRHGGAVRTKSSIRRSTRVSPQLGVSPGKGAGQARYCRAVARGGRVTQRERLEQRAEDADL